MVRQNQNNEKDSPETRISGFWLQRSGSLLASLSCRFFTDLISAGSDQARFLPRPIVFMLGRPTEVGNLCRWWYGILAGAVPHGMHMGPIGSNPVAWNIDMAGWIRHPRMDVHIPHRPSPIARRKRCRSQLVPSPCLPPKGSPFTVVLSSFTDTQRNSMLVLSLWPPSNRDDKKRRPLPSRPRDRGQVLLAGGPVLLRLLNPNPFSQDRGQHQASVIVDTAGILGWPLDRCGPEWHPKFLNRVAKVLRQKYDGLQIPVLVLAIMAWLRTTPTLKSGTGTGPDSESEAQERGLDYGDGVCCSLLECQYDRHADQTRQASQVSSGPRQFASPELGGIWSRSFHGIDGMAWCGPGTVVSSEHHRHFNHSPIASHAQVRIRTLRYGHCGWRCYPAVPNAALILKMSSSMVRFERARREKNATARDLHNGEQQHKTMKSQGTNWEGQVEQTGGLCPATPATLLTLGRQTYTDAYAHAHHIELLAKTFSRMPHDKQMLDACEDRDPTSIGDVLPLELPSVVWHIHEGVRRTACVWVH
ncbi:hypothetical protein CSIM01_13781 [Colletotrichum simmondsii]|uniref:Uncharacterized protein n=1 Tax=Colletotrichum simmondsii TaxID=703756 RepID=A0A135TZF8_9PEZI|nr:hypothetical protein CSIM01_13781 [Colletotrichum simmondsii]